MPGHTPGSTAYLWDSGTHRFLFTADSLYLGGDGRWRAAVLESSDREQYVRSLELLRELDSTCWCRGRRPRTARTWTWSATPRRGGGWTRSSRGCARGRRDS